MIDWFSDGGNILQLGLTVTFAALTYDLNQKYGPTVIRAFKDPYPWTAPTWLAVGITFGFNFNVVDWGYWAVTWFVVLFNLPQEATMFRYGPLSNLLFRQVPTIYAIYCHLYAAQMMHGGEPVKLKQRLWLGVYASAILTVFKGLAG